MIISVNTSRNYDIMLDSNIVTKFGGIAADIFGCSKAVIVTDSNVASLYLDKLSNSLTDAGFKVINFVFPAGENNKSLATLDKLLTFLTENMINKGDLLVALGGGIVSDLTGFAASCYLRGMPYATVATSLLAAVDASIGGKTAVDHAGQKNNVGAFYPPYFVMIDTDLLTTLPEQELKNGLVEAIKSGALLDAELFNRFLKPINNEDYTYIIERSLLVKRHYVEQDELDNGLRQLLNLGHTLGHAIEAESGYSIPHGQAVAAGMVAILRSGEAAGLTKKGVSLLVENVLSAQGVEYTLPYPIDKLVPHIAGDKKMRKSSLSLALLEDIGQAFVHKIALSDVRDFLRKGN